MRIVQCSVPHARRGAHRGLADLAYTSGMERFAMAVALVVALASHARAGVEIVAAGDRLDVTAVHASVSEVLDGLARKTGMKVVYEGTIPRTPVNVELRDRTPAQAVLGLLDGLGLNYALVLDASGTEVDTLMIVGTGGTGARAGSAGSVRPSPRGGRMKEAAPADLDNATMENEEPTSPVEEEGVPAASAASPDAPKVDENAKPAVGVVAPVVGPLIPTRGFPNVSPFAPGALAPALPSPVMPTPSPTPTND